MDPMGANGKLHPFGSIPDTLLIGRAEVDEVARERYDGVTNARQNASLTKSNLFSETFFDRPLPNNNIIGLGLMIEMPSMTQKASEDPNLSFNENTILSDHVEK